MKKIIVTLIFLSFLLSPVAIVKADIVSDCLKKAQDAMSQSTAEATLASSLAEMDALRAKNDSLKQARDAFATARASATKKKDDAIAAAEKIQDPVTKEQAIKLAINDFNNSLIKALQDYNKARKPVFDQYWKKIQDITKILKDKISAIQKKFEDDKKSCGNLGFIDCGTAPDNMEEDASGKPNHYDAFVCLGKAVLNNCQPAKLVMVDESGEVSYNLSVEKSSASGCIGKVGWKEKGTNPDDTSYVKYLSGQCDLNLEKIREKETLFEKSLYEMAVDFMPYYWITNQLFVLSATAAPASLDLNQVPPEFRSEVQDKINRIYGPAADLGDSLGIVCNR